MSRIRCFTCIFNTNSIRNTPNFTEKAKNWAQEATAPVFASGIVVVARGICLQFTKPVVIWGSIGIAGEDTMIAPTSNDQLIAMLAVD